MAKKPNETPNPAAGTNVVALPRLAYVPEVKDTYGVDVNGWRALCEAIFPAAKSSEAIMLALEYCKRRNFDVFKRPVHIVPVWNSVLRKEVETVWPGIAELRTTAMRTGNYAGMDTPTFGPVVTRTFKGERRRRSERGDISWEKVEATVTFPEWVQITVYRKLAGDRCPFPGPRVWWTETFAFIAAGCPVPNAMWEKRPSGQLEKCAEAAALRRAFPEELGNEYSVDEAETMRDITNEAHAETRDPEPMQGDPQVSDGAPQSSSDGGAEGSVPSDDRAVAKPSDLPADAPIEEPEPLQFELFQRFSDFFDFSEQFLGDPQRTPDEARQWEAFYRTTLRLGAEHNFERVKVGTAEAIAAYSAILARENKR